MGGVCVCVAGNEIICTHRVGQLSYDGRRERGGRGIAQFALDVVVH